MGGRFAKSRAAGMKVVESITRALPEPILAAIEGGEDTRDVRRARALLAEAV